ncbi:MAG: hypothetical protein COC02_04000 [Rhodospirillaceae bacterium]|jgi:hypothetical protein|nr:MAG: hypothetical protein COC02_04000 [Rhodospirillaceae bacterium]
MATGQSILDLMEVMDRGLQLQSGETGVTLGLRAVNAAQDFFESLLALQPNVMGSGVGTVTTAASTEATTFPTGLLRIDRLQFIDPSTSRPAWDLERIGPVGGYYQSQLGNALLAYNASTTGRPVRYWTDGAKIYWDPLPDATHTIRYYGFTVASDLTAAGTFAYPDIVLMPLATFATKLMRVGKDDNLEGVSGTLGEVFQTALTALTRFNRDRPPGYDYRYLHTE